MPNGGGCVAFDSRTGVCNGGGAVNATANGWVYDNQKKVCDGMPYLLPIAVFAGLKS